MSAHAQITFTASELPAVAGDYVQEYVSANIDPSAMIGAAGGPRTWDFSQAPQSGDIIRRVDIVLPTDGGLQAIFPNASYAEYYTDNTGTQERDYYSISNNGRHYFGSCVPNSVTNTFSPAAIDVPAIVGYGTNWSYTTSTTVTPFTEQDSVSVSVDAFGTVILPNLGSFPALRVNQLTTILEFDDILLLNTYYTREYYWLVPGFDKAVHIVSQLDYTPPPANFTSASEVRRVFMTNTVTVLNLPSTVSGLTLKRQTGLAVLNWLAVTNASSYQVQASGNLATTNWQILASPISNSWSETLVRTQRFYRVFAEP